MGPSTYRRFVVKNKNIPLGYQEEWDRISQVLQVELSDTQRLLISEKSRQPLCSTKPEVRSKGKSGKNAGESSYSTYVENGDNPSCLICGKNNHKSYVSPYSGERRVSTSPAKIF